MVLFKTASGKADAENEIKRNPHGDFKAVEASRPTFETAKFHYTQTPKPGHQALVRMTSRAWRRNIARSTRTLKADQ
jgi:hypothetical protein